ncbi:MAG: cytochrome c maturation protein CcmE [Phycisphaerae bacterium]|nr:cytochrome c maturation protein CcmE [Phycisphaerae bacterium]
MNGMNFIKLIIGVFVIGGGMSFLVYNAMSSSWAYDISVDDFVTKDTARSHTARVGGVVAAGSIENDLENVKVSFKLKGQTSELDVIYSGVLPDNFQENREVLAEGSLDTDGIFQANKVITKCESKYQAKVREGDSSKDSVTN